MIKLIRPEKEHEEQALSFKKEFLDNGESVINGSELWDQTNSYDDWLQMIRDNANEATVNPDWVVTDTFFAMNEKGTLVGMIDLRHELNGFLKDFGNTGYSVRPTERNKGYATQMLAELLKVASAAGLKELQISVERTNTPSVKTILTNKGEYLRSFVFEKEQADIYKIKLY